MYNRLPGSARLRPPYRPSPALPLAAFALVAVAAGLCGCAGAGQARRGESLDERAARIHRDAIVIDTHNDIPTVMFETGVDLADPQARQRVPHLHTDIARLRAGGITGEFFSIYVDAALAEKPTAIGGGPARRALDLIDLTYQQTERHPDALVLATSVDDIRRAKREGKVACLMGIEGGHAIESSMGALREFYRLGVRYMTLTHTNTNEWADSAGFAGPPVVRHHGLSPFGVEVVREMQRIGMLVDISHVSDETFYKVMEVAKTPVIASHSSARALAPHRRNMDDDMLRALAKNGGVVMVNYFAGFLDGKYMEAEEAFAKRHEAELTALRERYKDDAGALEREMEKLHASEPSPRPPLERIVDHIEHIIQVAGVDHVGLGSDFDGVPALPAGLDGVDGVPLITRELLRRGHSEADVRKVLGENFLRVFAAAEAYARATHTTLSGDGNNQKLK